MCTEFTGVYIILINLLISIEIRKNEGGQGAINRILTLQLKPQAAVLALGHSLLGIMLG
jgi:hypothetical protein